MNERENDAYDLGMEGNNFATYSNASQNLTLHSSQPSERVSLNIPPLMSLFSLPAEDTDSQVILIGITTSYSVLFIHAVLPPASLSLSLHAETTLPLDAPPKMIIPVDPMGWSKAFNRERATSGHDILLTVAEDGELAINCVIGWHTVFNKSSQKFVQWHDVVGMVYGLGFDSEANWNDFIEAFMQQGTRLGPSQLSTYPSKTNGRATAELNATNSSRGGGAGTTTQYSNSSAYIGNNTIDNEQAAISNGSPNERVRQPSRGQGAQVIKSSGNLGEVDGPSSTTGRPSPEAEDLQSNNEDFQIREQLKYENERLKQALEETSKSAGLWQNELMNLRTNNVKLTQALQESKAHVSEWEKELFSLRDENKELNLRIMALESMNDSSKSDEYKIELQKYKDYVDDIQEALRKKEDEVEDLQMSMQKLEIKANANNQNGDSNADILNNNGGLSHKMDLLLKINAKLDAKTNELSNVQKELASLLGDMRKS